MAHSHIGPYEILGCLGAGGMGEVFRARDSALQRDVAIKILPADVAHDPDRLARFEREAQALAALNHQNIAHIYGVERITSSDERRQTTSAIVMEFVDGETLAARIRQGAVPLADALPIARQIAEALAAAHAAGIVHRDLKPANVMVTDDGTVKVLDFGLAKALAPDASTTSNVAGPTISLHATEHGLILGTAAYMAPEQARGKTVDKRADVWAFGVVLYEMLTARKPFDAADVTDIFAHILTKDPDWATLPATTPHLIRRLLVRCLTKDLKQRLHDIADARLEIDEATAPQPVSHEKPRLEKGWLRWQALALAAATLSIGLGVGWLLFNHPPKAPHRHVLMDVRPAEEVASSDRSSSTQLLSAGPRTAIAWSPDGKTLAFLGKRNGVRQLYIRDLESEDEEAQVLKGTDGASSLAFSPDGQWLAFWADNKIQKVAVRGGPPAKICDAALPDGLTWGQHTLVFASPEGLRFVDSAGGQPGKITDLPLNTRHTSPFLLPGEVGVLFTEHNRHWTSGGERVMVQRLGADSQAVGTPVKLLEEAADARYLNSGHLAFLKQGVLNVVSFDLKSLKLAGNVTPVRNNVAQMVIAGWGNDLTFAGHFAVSPQNDLAFVAAPLPEFRPAELVSVDRSGHVLSLGKPAGNLTSLTANPDGSVVAAIMRSRTAHQPVLWDVSRKNLQVLGPVSGEWDNPEWSKLGQIAARVSDNGQNFAMIFQADSSAAPERVKDSDGFWPSSWSPNGRLLIGRRNSDIWIYTPGEPDTKPRPFFETPGIIERNAVWSPDGNWIAYVSDKSKGAEIYVRPYPGPGVETKVSQDGGSNPAWNPAQHELFYINARKPVGGYQMMAVDMSNPARPGTAISLFPFLFDELSFGGSPSNIFTVAPNGNFYVTAPLKSDKLPPVTHINVIFNWLEELKTRTNNK